MLEDGPVVYRIKVVAEGPARLRLNVYRFPGWSWRIDGHPAADAAPTGRRPIMTVDVPAGEHEVEALFSRTPPRWIGDLASLASALAIAGLLAAGIRKSSATS
jgi:hypothetical protein